jgi:hypothetical protein
MAPSAARRETCLSVDHRGVRTWCAAQWRGDLRRTDVRRAGRSRCDVTTRIVAACCADRRPVQRNCRRLPTRQECRDPGAACADKRRTAAPSALAQIGNTPAILPLSPCHRAGNPAPPAVRPAATPRKCLQHPAGVSGEVPFSTRKPRVAMPDRRHFRDQVSGKSPGISPPKFRPSSIGPAESDPPCFGVAPRRGSHPDVAVAEASTCANYRLGGTPRTSIKRASAL